MAVTTGFQGRTFDVPRTGVPMGVDRRTVTLGCSCGGSQPPQAAGALMRTETSHEAREDQRKSPIGR